MISKAWYQPRVLIQVLGLPLFLTSLPSLWAKIGISQTITAATSEDWT